MLGNRVDELVGRLRLAQLVKVDRDGLGAVALSVLALRIATVVEAGSIHRPGRAAELGEVQKVAAILACIYVPHPPRLPVGSAVGLGIGDQLPVTAHAPLRKGHGRVLRERVRVDERAGLRSVEPITHVQNALVLQALVLREEVAAVFLAGQSEALEVPEFGDTRLDRITGGQALEVRKRNLVLGLDPGLDRLALHLLHPAIRIGDFHSVVLVHVVRPRRARIVVPVRRLGEFGHGRVARLLPTAGGQEESEREGAYCC